MSAQRKQVIVVNTDAMMNDTLYRRLRNKCPASKVSAMQVAITEACKDRSDFEATVERRSASGVYWTGQSNDIKHVQALGGYDSGTGVYRGNDAVARLFVALKLDPVQVIFPQSQVGGKTSSETSNLKGYKKLREIAETIWTGSSTLENTVKVFTACAYTIAHAGKDVLERRYAEDFLSSREYRSISQGSEDFLRAVEEVDSMRRSEITGGKQTQTSQMIRQLVALGSATDVRDGRAKNVRIHADGLVMQALMRRFGQVTDVVDHDALATVDVSDVASDDMLALVNAD
jgi:hypothetical protein